MNQYLRNLQEWFTPVTIGSLIKIEASLPEQYEEIKNRRLVYMYGHGDKLRIRGALEYDFDDWENGEFIYINSSGVVLNECDEGIHCPNFDKSKGFEFSGWVVSPDSPYTFEIKTNYPKAVFVDVEETKHDHSRMVIFSLDDMEQKTFTNVLYGGGVGGGKKATFTSLKVLMEVEDEIQKSRGKWGIQNHNPMLWLPILMEEVGEVSQAALEAFFSTQTKYQNAYPFIKPNNYQKARNELVQVAAVAVKMIECIDRGKFDQIEN